MWSNHELGKKNLNSNQIIIWYETPVVYFGKLLRVVMRSVSSNSLCLKTISGCIYQRYIGEAISRSAVGHSLVSPCPVGYLKSAMIKLLHFAQGLVIN